MNELSSGSTHTDKAGVVDVTEPIDRHIQRAGGDGQPRITGRRIAVADIAVWHERLGLSADEISGEYDLTLAQVYAALAYCHEHREDIDGELRDSSVFVDGLKQQIASKIPGKLGGQPA